MGEPKLKDSTDQQVVQECLEGDKESYRILVDRYKERAYYLALMFTKNHEDARDLSQEAFYRAYRALADYDPSRPFYSWFYRILKNLCINFVNHHRRKLPMDENLERTTMAEGDFPDEIFEKNERAAIIWKALSQLPEKDREIIVMKEFNDFSYQEIADALEIPIGSVMSRLYYARKKLLKKLQQFEDAL